MSTINVERQPKAEDLARRKRMTEAVLEGWDQLTWNELLADDIVLSLRLVGSISAELASFANVAAIFR